MLDGEHYDSAVDLGAPFQYEAGIHSSGVLRVRSFRTKNWELAPSVCQPTSQNVGRLWNQLGPKDDRSSGPPKRGAAPDITWEIHQLLSIHQLDGSTLQDPKRSPQNDTQLTLINIMLV